MYRSHPPPSRVENSFDEGAQSQSVHHFEPMEKIKANLKEHIDMLGEIQPEPPRDQQRADRL